jgi:hypothetical protein
MTCLDEGVSMVFQKNGVCDGDNDIISTVPLCSLRPDCQNFTNGMTVFVFLLVILYFCILFFIFFRLFDILQKAKTQE